MPPKRRSRSCAPKRKTKRRTTGEINKATERSTPDHSEEEINKTPNSSKKDLEHHSAGSSQKTRASLPKNKVRLTLNHSVDKDKNSSTSNEQGPFKDDDNQFHDESETPPGDLASVQPEGKATAQDSVKGGQKSDDHAKQSNTQSQHRSDSQVKGECSSESKDHSNDQLNGQSSSQTKRLSRWRSSPDATRLINAILQAVNSANEAGRRLCQDSQYPRIGLEAESNEEPEEESEEEPKEKPKTESKEPKEEPKAELNIYPKPRKNELLSDEQLSVIRRNMSFLEKDGPLGNSAFWRMRLGNTRAEARAAIDTLNGGRRFKVPDLIVKCNSTYMDWDEYDAGILNRAPIWIPENMASDGKVSGNEISSENKASENKPAQSKVSDNTASENKAPNNKSQDLCMKTANDKIQNLSDGK
ncbi:hypothetical protein B7463_g6458, partial [Scytalidium lignicola]